MKISIHNNNNNNNNNNIIIIIIIIIIIGLNGSIMYPIIYILF